MVWSNETKIGQTIMIVVDRGKKYFTRKSFYPKLIFTSAIMDNRILFGNDLYSRGGKSRFTKSGKLRKQREPLTQAHKAKMLAARRAAAAGRAAWFNHVASLTGQLAGKNFRTMTKDQARAFNVTNRHAITAGLGVSLTPHRRELKNRGHKPVSALYAVNMGARGPVDNVFKAAQAINALAAAKRAAGVGRKIRYNPNNYLGPAYKDLFTTMRRDKASMDEISAAWRPLKAQLIEQHEGKGY